jgi:hypothetical protein
VAIRGTRELDEVEEHGDEIKRHRVYEQNDADLQVRLQDRATGARNADSSDGKACMR